MFSGLLVSFINRQPKILMKSAALLVFVVIAGYGLVYSMAYNSTRVYQNDARVRTALWMEANIPQKNTVAVLGKVDFPGEEPRAYEAAIRFNLSRI